MLTGSRNTANFYRMGKISNSKNPFGQIKTASELGHIVRVFRKDQKFSLEKISGITHLSMRFLSELERGKETAELGKALEVLNKLGLEIIIQPRDRGLQTKNFKDEQ